MNKTVLVLNGKSVLNIIRDVKTICNVQDEHFLVITDNHDEIKPPDGLAHRAIGEISVDDLSDVEYLIGNGGRTRQLVPLIIKLLRMVGEKEHRHHLEDAPRPQDIQIWDIQNAEERTTKNSLMGVITPSRGSSNYDKTKFDVGAFSLDGTIREP